LRHAGLLHRFNAVVGADLVARVKPAPDVYIEAAKRLGLTPADCVALDDSDLGVRAAIAAGMMIVIQVPDMVASRELIAHHQASSLDDARAILGLASK
jgi:beta-phosphoglucomutase-like phosphatase (HAD superfamily)